ncbi:protein neprosin-like isoform X2 [Tasmannia lanceolata]|uniref:protein neprosin-like isoform X2 n=1 Tax=Tasmannia lanceolata TaxID=3420 RepID=UPI004062E23E
MEISSDCSCIISYWSLLNLAYYNVEGGRSLSKEDDLEVERQLKILNKPAIKSIWTEHGDIFDCVDINKQPAFDHPLLKNHKVQMRPKSFRKEMMRDGGSSVHKSLQIGLKDGGCPTGTVPIRRIQKEDLTRTKSSSNTKNYPSNIHPLGSSDPVQNSFLKASGDTYYGTTLLINTWSINVSAEQSSLVGTWVANQQDNIQAGWIAQPKLFGDSKTRLFTLWTNDNYKTTCYNTFCPGFVQVSRRIPLGMVLPISTYGGTQTEIEIDVAKDASGGNWWLTWGPEHENVGYWPQKLFQGLAMNSSFVGWGGQAYSPPGSPEPIMGNGHSGTEGYGKACYIRNVKLLNYQGYYYTPDPNHTAGYGEKCYALYVTSTRPEYQFYIGGPTC